MKTLATDRKRLLILPLCLLLLTTFVLFGCSTPAPTPTSPPVTSKAPTQTASPSATPTQTTPPATSAPVVTIKVHYSGPKTAVASNLGAATFNYFKGVADASGGRLKIQDYWDSSITTAAETVNGIKSGLIDASGITPSFFPSQMPISQISNLPFVSTSDPFIAGSSWTEFGSTYQPLIKEERASNLIFLGTVASTSIDIISNKNVKTLTDLKGLKLRTVGKYDALVLQKFGVVPISMTPPDIFDAMQKGVVDGASISIPAMISYHLNEVAKSVIMYNYGCIPQPVVLNLDTWNKIPADLQKMLTDKGVALSKVVADALVTDKGNAIADFQKRGIVVSTAPDAEQQQVTGIAQSEIWSVWTKDVESKGLPGTEALQTYRNIVQKYSKK